MKGSPQSAPPLGRGNSDASTGPGSRPTIEEHSIDYIPADERHGKVWHQAPFWFTGAFVLPTMAIGFLGPATGLGLAWSLVAVVAGMGLGTAFMALHANQGPRLGLPQMIQSRAQFGIRGAAFPLTVAVGIYIGYNVFNLLLAREALGTVIDAGSWWYIVLMGVAALVSIVGYDLLHLVQRYLSYLLIVVFAILTVGAIVHFSGGGHHTSEAFSLKGFVIQFAAATGYQISYAIYVSDYSRYLPEDVSAKKVIGYTYLGATVGSAWLGCLGVLLASFVVDPDPVSSVRSAGNTIFGGFGTFTVLISIPALIGTSAINSYGAMLTGSTVLDSFRRVRPTRMLRIVGVLLVSVVAVVVTFVMPESFLADFSSYITIMTYSLVPWTAVNLVDYYVVRRGHYKLSEFFTFRPGGVWAWRGLTAYFLGWAAMVPCFSVSFFQGPVAKALGGGDISFAVGLIVAGGGYYLICRCWPEDVTVPDLPSVDPAGNTPVIDGSVTG